MNLMKYLGISGADEEAAKLAKAAKVSTPKGTPFSAPKLQETLTTVRTDRKKLLDEIK